MDSSDPQELQDSGDITELLLKWNRGDKSAEADLMKVLYGELYKRAKHYLRRERPDHTLQPTALVHEVYLKLIRQDVQWQNRAQFYGVAAQMMRRILVDHARNRYAGKRGGGALKLSLDEAARLPEQQCVDLILLDDALQDLAKFDPDQSRIIELRFFGGLSVKETAEVLNISVSTVMREWQIAKMWLYNAIKRMESEQQG